MTEFYVYSCGCISGFVVLDLFSSLTAYEMAQAQKDPGANRSRDAVG